MASHLSRNKIQNPRHSPQGAQSCPLAISLGTHRLLQLHLLGWPHLLLQSEHSPVPSPGACTALPRSLHCPPRTALCIHLNPISAQIREATSSPHCHLHAVSSQHPPLDCRKTILRGSLTSAHLANQALIALFFLHNLFKNVCAARGLGDKDSIFL